MEESEQWPQGMIQHESMAVATTCSGKNHRSVGKRVLVDEIEKMLEHSRVRTAEHR